MGGREYGFGPCHVNHTPSRFSNLIGEHSLFQQSALRLISSAQVDFAPHITLTNANFRFIIGEQLQTIGIDAGPILIEPEGKNTAPAILATSIYAQQADQDAILLIAPSDHVIPDTDAFHSAVALGLAQVQAGNIVTFGITPDRAETGYGYLELAGATAGAAVALTRFVEKPDSAAAQPMVDAGTYLWNAGIFMFRAADMIAACEKYASDLIAPVRGAIDNGKPDLGFFRLDPAAWADCSDISIDYAVMERADNLVAIPFSAGWSDLGGWDAVWQEQGPDENGVVALENATAVDCSNVLLRSESSGQHVVGLGLDNIIAIAMPDAVLVAHKDQAQNVKKVVTKLKEQNVPQAELLPKDHRPWGWFETLAIRGRFQVKRIMVHPGAALSLQSHHHRSEPWIVVEGTAKVTIDEDVKLISEGQSVYIPLGAVHRMENPGKVPMLLIEVQTGAYLGEDDIIRYEDICARD